MGFLVGLGNIGGPCARHLAEAGHRLTVFDVDEAAAGRLAEAGARAAASVAGGAGASEAGVVPLPTPAASEFFIGAIETLEAEASFTAPIPPGMDGS
ncbi:MAG: NAD(P)-binding domain-containing protein [Acidimicrobiaceae bacterium]|nr:NAD(P)-binding domain-containing protein [Acidimicrobiaceae bacterium]